MVKTFKKEFEKIITELGFSLNSSQEGFYILCDENVINHTINAQLIESILPNKQKYGSKNGNDIQVIGMFFFKQIKTAPKPDFFIFTFPNPSKKQAEYLVIPKEELDRRMINAISDSNHYKLTKLVFWLMKDGSIYNATNISPEGEWYLMSKGIIGSMVDGTDWDFTGFLNEWSKLKAFMLQK